MSLRGQCYCEVAQYLSEIPNAQKRRGRFNGQRHSDMTASYVIDIQLNNETLTGKLFNDSFDRRFGAGNIQVTTRRATYTNGRDDLIIDINGQAASQKQ